MPTKPTKSNGTYEFNGTEITKSLYDIFLSSSCVVSFSQRDYKREESRGFCTGMCLDWIRASSLRVRKRKRAAC